MNNLTESQITALLAEGWLYAGVVWAEKVARRHRSMRNGPSVGLLLLVVLSLAASLVLTIPAAAQAPNGSTADFGFIQGKGYPKEYLPLVTAALEAASVKAQVDMTSVLDRWDSEKRQQSVFSVLLEMLTERPTSAPVSAEQEGPVVCKVLLVGNGGELVRCEGGSIWEVMREDQTHSLFWKPGQELRASPAKTPQRDYRFLLDNASTGDRVYARPIE